MEETQGPSNQETEQTPAPSPRPIQSAPAKSKNKIILIALLALLLASLGGIFAYAELVAPKRAPLNYLDRVLDSESGSYETQLTAELEDSDLELSAAGTYIDHDDESSDLTSDIEASIGGDGFTMDFELSLIALDQDLYIKIKEAGLLSALSGGKLDKDAWYKAGADDDELDAYTSGCSSEDIKAIRKYLRGDAKKVLKVENGSREGFLGEDLEGRFVQHYKGELSDESVRKLSDDIDELVSEDCQSEEADEEDEDKRYIYEIWTGRNFDRLKLTVIKDGEATLDLTLTTQDYGRDVKIEKPSGDIKPLEELFSLDSIAPQTFESSPVEQPSMQQFEFNSQTQTQTQTVY